MADDTVHIDPPERAVVASVLYRPRRAPMQVPLSQVASCANATDGLLWIGLCEPTSVQLEQLGADLGFSRKAIEEISSPHRRPKVIEFEELILIVAITVEVENLRPSFGDTQILIGKGFLVTIRRGATATHQTLRDQLENSPEFLGRGSDYVASALLDLLVDRYINALTKLETVVESAEQQFLFRGFRETDVRRLHRLRRDLLRIHTAIAPMAEISRRLSRVEMRNIDAESRAYFGEVADRILRANEFINSLREALAFAFEASLMIGQAQQTDTTKKLASWAAILAVPTAVAGIYGMNFKYMPELDWVYGYPVVMGSTIAVCALLYWKFKKSNWL
ncbi:magnesium and cobalt transport protein CorA [Candidimonas sp. SYP-B2681]|uniref:magnesium and cobalt transport protein CorA n=1 Tax=Candidimonas sp. SYP-B2681 TaxID=2497686 RepID=UPI000F87F53A|nr:magnesium and cobalt transport protein CorA [Candidimonas sp. SYP-B2681]RTZ44524.1 magnesium and cobalt transport protein CorA [Candidimonas sp. SYP-B2681]